MLLYRTSISSNQMPSKYTTIRDSIQDFSRRENAPIVTNSTKNKSLDPKFKIVSMLSQHHKQGNTLHRSVHDSENNYNSRCYTSCEDSGFNNKSTFYSRNTTKRQNMINRLNPNRVDSRYSDQFEKPQTATGLNNTNRSNGRSQSLSMYCMSNIGTYNPLSAKMLISGQSEDFATNYYKKNSPTELRKKRGISDNLKLTINYKE